MVKIGVKASLSYSTQLSCIPESRWEILHAVSVSTNRFLFQEKLHSPPATAMSHNFSQRVKTWKKKRLLYFSEKSYVTSTYPKKKNFPLKGMVQLFSRTKRSKMEENPINILNMVFLNRSYFFCYCKILFKALNYFNFDIKSLNPHAILIHDLSIQESSIIVFTNHSFRI